MQTKFQMAILSLALRHVKRFSTRDMEKNAMINANARTLTTPQNANLSRASSRNAKSVSVKLKIQTTRISVLPTQSPQCIKRIAKRDVVKPKASKPRSISGAMKKMALGTTVLHQLNQL